MYSRLCIDGVDVGFKSELPISTNFAVADVREPDKRNASYSKTIAIPGVKEVNILFEFAFEVNAQFLTFNPNLKVPASYFSNEVEVFKGDLQLLNITQNNGALTYNCNIVGMNANLFLSLTDKYLTDLADPVKGYPIPGMPGQYGFTDLNHTISYANFSAAPTIGVGYCYGYIDYGLAGMNGWNWRVDQMKAAIFELEYLKRIFAASGYTFTSTFLASAYYKRIAIPDVNEGPYQFSPAQITNNQFYAGKTAATLVNATTINLVGSVFSYRFNTNITPVIFNDDSTTPFNDPGAQYNTGTGIFTLAQGGQHQITCSLNYTVTLDCSLIPAAAYFVGTSYILLQINNTTFNTQYIVIANAAFTAQVTGANAVAQLNISASFIANIMPAGTQYEVDILGYTGSGTNGTIVGTFYDVFDNPTTGLGSLNGSYNITSAQFYNNLASTNQTFSNTVDMNTTIPKDVKQIDFLTSIIKSHNLYMEQDKTDPFNYVIEPRDTFIQTTNPLVWTDKHDTSKDTVVLPMGDLDARSYTLTFKPDQDYFNKQYQDKWKEIYGQHLTNVRNDFVKTDKKIEVIFSPSPGVSFQCAGLVAPRLLSIEGAYPGTGMASIVKSVKCNIRRLYYGGMKPCADHGLMVTAGIYQTQSTYPSLNHVDDPNNPAIDLCFGSPREIYWNLPAQMYTTDNLFGRYYKKFIDEITDPNSKVVKAYLLLNEDDIAQFSFRKIVYLKNAYFYVNRISDYDPQVRKSIMVELLKLKAGATFSPAVYQPWNPPAGQQFTMPIRPELNWLNNYGQAGALNVGRNLNNGSEAGLLTGQNTNIQRGVTDFDGIGMNGQNVGQEYSGRFVTRNGAMVISNNGLNKLKYDRLTTHTSITMTDDVQLYCVDASAGNVDVTLPGPSANNSMYTLVRVDDSVNVVTVYAHSGERINSIGVSATTDVVPGYTTRRYFTNYTDWYY
jgi:hypothetical protein